MPDLGNLPAVRKPVDGKDDNGRTTGGRELGLLGAEGVTTPLPEVL